MKRVFSRRLVGVPPFNFDLTVHNPAGWHWNNPFEAYSKGSIWTGLHLSTGKLVGLRVESEGTVEEPRVSMCAYSGQKLTSTESTELTGLVVSGLGFNEHMSAFYSAVEIDQVLQSTVKRLYGMHRGTVLSTHVFNSALLALCLQNAPISRTNQMLDLLIRNYGDQISFDGKTTYTWPKPQTIMKTGVADLRGKCKVGYRAKYLKSVAKAIHEGACPTVKELNQMSFREAKAEVMKLKGIGEYSAEIILTHGEVFPIDVWSAQIFWKLFFPQKPVPSSKQETIKAVRETAKQRWGLWQRLAFVYVVCDLPNLMQD